MVGMSLLESKVAHFIDQLRELAASNLVSTGAVTPRSIQPAGQHLETNGAVIVHLKCHHLHSSQLALGCGIPTPSWSQVTSCVPDPNAQHLVAIFANFYTLSLIDTRSQALMLLRFWMTLSRMDLGRIHVTLTVQGPYMSTFQHK